MRKKGCCAVFGCNNDHLFLEKIQWSSLFAWILSMCKYWASAPWASHNYSGPKVSRQFKFTHGNFNFTYGNFNLFTAISIRSRQFQLTDSNFNLFTAISIYSRQRSRHFSLRSPPVNFSSRQWPPKVKTQNQKSLFKVNLQSEKWKSKIESRFTRFTNTYASRQWEDNRRVYWSQKIISFI